MSVRGVGLTAVILLTSCATISRTDREWLDARDGQPTDAPPPGTAAVPDAAQSPPAPSVEEVAVAMRDDIACDQAVRDRELAHDPQGAIDLLLACARRNKWTNLRQFLRLYKGSATAPAAVALLGRILARRGGQFAADLPACQEAGWPVFSLSDALAHKPMPARAWVIFLAKTHTEERAPSGARSIELTEMSRGSEDVNAYAVFFGASSVTAYDLGRAGSEDFLTPSGVVLRGQLSPQDPSVPADTTLVILGQVGEAPPGEEDLPRVKIMAHYEPGVSGF